MEIVVLGKGDLDRVTAAGYLFDGELQLEATTRFLDEPGHHLLIAYVDGIPVGYVSGVEMTHPDKGTEMFLYELAVADAHRRQGIAVALVNRLAELARQLNCYGMWVATEPENLAAIATYRRAGAVADPPITVVLAWDLRRPPASRSATPPDG
ncbi:MAG: GNAT family N-acetyltransferase [Candidatus Dormibacteria bacterium]